MPEGDWDEYDAYWRRMRSSRTAHFRIGSFEHPGPRRGVTEETIEYVKPDEQGEARTHLSATVVHRPERQTFAYPSGSPEAFSGTGNRFSNAENEMLAGGPGGQGKLFGMHTQRGRSYVDWLGGPRTGRPHVMTMLGIAANRTRETFGRSLEPSENLSRHSSKLVGHLVERGVINKAITEPSNDIEFPAKANLTDLSASERLPEADVKRGRRSARRLMKKAPSRAPSRAPSTQLSLFP